MNDTDLKRAQRALAVSDVYVCEAVAWADRQFDPAIPLQQPINVQMRVDNAGPAQTFPAGPDDGASHIVRYYVETGLRILKATANQEDPMLPREQLLGEITATFVLRYLWTSKETPAANLLAAFADNAIHHMWPYWREFLQASTTRLRLPPFVLPMRVAEPPAERAKIAEHSTT